MKRLLLIWPVLWGLLLALAAGPAQAAKAHEHGVAKLTVAVDAKRVTLSLDAPLDSLVGFEHAPRSAAERKAAEAAVVKLRHAAKLFRIDPAAQCQLTTVDLVSAPLKLGAPRGKDTGHGDLDGGFEFTCKHAGRAAFVSLGLFEAFPRLQRIDVQVATGKGQLKATLRRPANRVALAR